MRYFDYHKGAESMGHVWSLFSDLSKSTEDSRLHEQTSGYGHTLEIIHAAMNGSFNGCADSFSLSVYERACNRNDKFGELEKRKKVVNIVDSNAELDGPENSYGDISDKKLPHYDEALDIMMNDDEFNANLMRLLNIRKSYVVEHGVDVVTVLYNALRGIPDAVKEVASLVSTHCEIKDIFVSLCEDSTDGKLMKELAAVVS